MEKEENKSILVSLLEGSRGKEAQGSPWEGVID